MICLEKPDVYRLELSDCRSLTSQRTSPMKQTLQLSRHGSRVFLCLSQCSYHLRVCRINPQAEFLGSGDEEDFDAEVPFTVSAKQLCSLALKGGVTFFWLRSGGRKESRVLSCHGRCVMCDEIP